MTETIDKSLLSHVVKPAEMEWRKTKFDGVLADLRDPEAPALPFTQEQTEARLALLDPSAASSGGVDPRSREELIRQMNQMLQRQPPQE